MVAQSLGDLVGIKTRVQSKTRVNQFLQDQNKSSFHPQGLHVQLCTTKAMLRITEFPGDTLHLTPLADTTKIKKEELTLARSQNGGLLPSDPRVRRYQAIKSHVAPLSFDVPPQIPSADFYGQLTAKQVKRLIDRGLENTTRERLKSSHWFSWRHDELWKENTKWEKPIHKVDSEISHLKNEETHKPIGKSPSRQKKILASIAEKLAKQEREREKLVAERGKKIAKIEEEAKEELDKIEEKETKEVQNIMWIVVRSMSRATGGSEASVFELA